MATHLAAYIPGKDFTRTLAGRLPRLGPNAQVTLLHALAVRGDKAALDAVTGACNSEDEAVRIAALAATGALGDASTVRTLAEHAAKAQGAELEAARAALSRCTSGRGEDINSAMAEQLKDADDGAKVELITALAMRQAVETTPAILETASSGSASVRSASYKALRNLAGAEDVAALFDLLVAAGQGERDEAVKTIASVARRCSVVESAAIPIAIGTLKKLGATKDAGLRTSMLTLLGDLGDGRALPVLKSALDDSDKRIQDAAVRSLSQWPAAGPGGEPMDDLLRIARTSDNKVHRVLALRGYINLITTADNLSRSQKVNACKTAMKLAERLSERRGVLARVAQIRSIEALGMAESYLADQDLKAEAAVAVTTIAQNIYDRHLRPVRAAMQQVLRQESLGPALDVPSFVLDKAKKIISDIDAIKDYLTDWQVAGPYMQQGKGGLQLFDIPFGPELLPMDPDAHRETHVQWKPMPVSTLGTHPAYLDLLKELNGGEQRVAYLRTTIQSEDERSVRLEIYSDDGVKAWLNGKVVHANNCFRPIPSSPDTVNVTLKKGPNDLMLKITQNNMPWGAIVLLREVEQQ
jgi:HEAT repeat protein